METAKPAIASIKKKRPEIRQITTGDIKAAVREGLADLRAASVYSLFFGLFYAASGWLLIYLFFNFHVSIYAYPITMGFPLIAPFISAGLYEISRRLTNKQPLDWPGILGSVKNAGGNDLSWMAVLTTFAYILWVDIAAAIYIGFFGLKTMEIGAFLELIFTTTNGLMFFVIGNFVGAILSAIMFSLTSVSFPLLYDRDIDFVTAMITSVNTVKKNPGPMALWAFIILALMAFAIGTAFVGLIFVLPLLGHATWHVYRRTIVDEAEK